jgi:threonylcarbamoyladenosine tRNA methylthiotransferase MtaB
MKVTLLTLGCRVNQAESSVIEGSLVNNGVEVVGLNENPDYCIINTCTVTAKSDYNSRQMIRRAVRAGSKVIVTGCYSQLKPDEIRKISVTAQIIDIKHKDDVVNIIAGRKIDLNYGLHSRSRPHLKVQDGCNFNCSYCAVPYARGSSRSIPIEEAVKRAQVMDANGHNEIVLTGIHLGSYGHDFNSGENLNNLLKALLKRTKIYRIRLSSLEINEVNDELLDIMQDKRICNHLHLPLQSGNDNILRKMRRNYSSEFFKQKIAKIALEINNISIGTDVIAGFPSEGEEEFKDTFNLINNLPFSYLHVFPFSSRSGTEAFLMRHRVNNKIVKERLSRLKELDRIKRNKYMEDQIGKSLDIIVEERLANNQIIGTSSNYLKISSFSEENIKGKPVFVRPESIENNMLTGSLIICI